MSVTVQLQNYTESELAHPEIPNVPPFASGAPGSKSRLLKQVNADDYSGRYDALAGMGVRVLEGGTARPGSAVHTAAGTIANTTHIALVDTDGPGFILVLPSAVTVGAGFKMWVFMRTDGGGNLTVDGSGAQTVMGAANQVLTAAGQMLALISDGVSNWEAL
jgi:hypothetical protein